MTGDITFGAQRSETSTEAWDSGDELQGSRRVHLARLDEELIAAGAEREDVRKRAARLAADAEVVRRLRAEGCSGPRTQKVADRLIEYGWRTVRPWIGSGEMFQRVREADRPIPQQLVAYDLTPDDRDQLATDAVIAGWRLFREHGLLRGRWRPEGGAGLNTYFVNAVIREYPAVYGRWFQVREASRALLLPEPAPDADADPIAAIPDQRATDPAAAAIARAELSRVWDVLSDPLVRHALLMRSEGYSQAEAAAVLGLSPKALERRVSRARSKVRSHMSRQLEVGEGGTR
jgi:DNA-directed RNA polymerase specialized sigma24 family protein